MISNEHPEVLERCMPDERLQPNITKSLELLANSQTMDVTSEAGTNLKVDILDAPCRAGAGYLTEKDKARIFLAFYTKHVYDATN